MSHFAVAVFTNERTTVEELLEPYDEDLAVDKYLQYTKEQLIEDTRRELEEIRTTTYAKYLEDPAAYLKKVCNGDVQNQHYQFISSEFMRRYNETDEQILQRTLSDYDDDMEGESMAPYEKAVNDGFYKSEYLKRMYPTKEVYEKIQTTFWTRAVITPDGEWHEIGEMGWFGCSSEEPEEIIKWVESYYDRFIAKAIKNDWDIHIIDCHI